MSRVISCSFSQLLQAYTGLKIPSSKTSQLFSNSDQISDRASKISLPDQAEHPLPNELADKYSKADLEGFSESCSLDMIVRMPSKTRFRVTLHKWTADGP